MFVPSFLRRAVSPLLLLSPFLYASVQAIGTGGMGPRHVKERILGQLGLPSNFPLSELPTSTEIVPEFVTMPIDHFGGHPGTFQNRFWVGNTTYTPGAPIFILDTGESDASPFAVSELLDTTSTMMEIVIKFGGLAIVWEHRYYGTSTPFTINLNTTAAEMQFLTSAQALADVDTFARGFSRPDLPHLDLTPNSTPWVFMGGSYPGMRAAFMRKFYPETIFASYASSPPVEARLNMTSYFDPVTEGMAALGWGNCTNDMAATLHFLDNELESPSEAAKLKTMFFGADAASSTNGGFAGAMWAMIDWQGSRMDGFFGDFCNWIETDPATNETSGPEGFVPTKGVNFIIDRWAAWPLLIESLEEDGLTCVKTTTPSVGTNLCDLDARVTDPSSISWTWQYCTEWGFLQIGNTGPTQLASRWDTIDWQLDFCHAQFPDGLSSGIMPAEPHIDATNAFFGGWDIRPSNVFWVSGDFDPWRVLEPFSTEAFSPMFQHTETPTACDVSSPEQAPFFGTQVPLGAHCYDLRPGFNQVALPLFEEALTGWLKCFVKKG